MINISDSDKNIWKSDSVHKEIVIRFPGKNITLGNEDILAESFELTETIEDSEQLSFTGCYASQIKFDCATFEEDVRNERIEVVLKADGAADMPLFEGWVDEQQRQDYEDETCAIIAYDDFYRLNTLDLGEWYEGLTFPMTQLAFRTALAQQVGLQMVNVSLIFDDLVLNKTIESSRVFASTFIKAICQLNGVFARINREGKLDFVSLVIDDSLYPSEELYPSEDIYPMEGLGEEIDKAYYTSIKHEGYEVDAIDKVQIHENPDDIGGVYGPGTNAYIVENNWMTYGRSGEELDRMAQTLYEKVAEYTYMPAEIECIGLPYLECGDFIEACTAKSYVFSYILSRTLKGIQALQDAYKAEGSKLREKVVSDVHEEIVQLKSQYNAMSRTVEGTYNEVFYYDSKEGKYKSRIEQNAKNITLKVDGETYSQDKQQIEQDISGKVDQTTYTEKMSSLDISINGITGAVFDSEGNSLIKQNHDEIELKVYKTTYDSKMSTIDQNINKINLAVFNSLGQSKIEILDGEISSKVSEGDVCSIISQSKDLITIKSNRISIDATNFTLDKNGNITATNADISGKISAKEGNIGGFTIKSSSLTSGTMGTLDIPYGVYVGTDGISCGSSSAKFKVTSSGALSLADSLTSISMGTVLKIDSDGIDTKKLEVKSLASSSLSKTELTPNSIKLIGSSSTIYATHTNDGLRVAGGAYTIHASTVSNHSSMSFDGSNVTISVSSGGKVQIGNLYSSGTANQKLAFFGAAGSSQHSKISQVTSATLGNLQTALNGVIEALTNYGLLRNV